MLRIRLLSSFIGITAAILLLIGAYQPQALAASALSPTPTATIDYYHQESRIRSVAFSPDGRNVSVLMEYGEVPIWDLQTGKRVRTLPGSVYLGFFDVAFSPDGKLIAAIASKQLVVWDKQTGKELQRFWTNIEGYDELSVTFTPDSRYIFIANEWGGVLWDVQVGEVVYTYPVITVDADPTVELSSDGKFVLTAGDKGIRLWDLQTGLPVHDWVVQYWAQAGFSPDGKYILINSYEYGLILWDAKTFKEVRRFPRPDGWITWQFSPNSKYFITDLDSITDGAPITLWDVQTGRKLRTFRFWETYGAFAAFLPDGEHLLIEEDIVDMRARENYPYSVWNIRSGKPILRFTLPLDEYGLDLVAFSPDGQYMVGGGAAPHVWRVKTFEKVHNLC